MSEAEAVSERSGRSERGPGSSCLRASAFAAALLGAAVLGGCASQPKPTEQLVRANTLVGEAEKSEAQRFAAEDLQRARDELSNAQTAESDGKYDSALHLADRAAADANLASARAASGKAQQSAEQVRHSIDTLKQQLQQSPAPSGDNGPGASGPGRDQQ